MLLQVELENVDKVLKLFSKNGIAAVIGEITDQDENVLPITVRS